MNVNCIPQKGRYLSGKKDQLPVQLTIRNCAPEFVRYQTAPVLEFHEIGERLILNRQNIETLTAIWGPETDEWINRRIELYRTDAELFGRSRQGIRVRPKT